MNETLKRALSGAVYVAVMWIGTSYSETTFSLLFAILGIVSIYEMWKLRKGKTKALAFLYVLIPFIIIQLFGMTDHDYPNIPFDPSLILFMFILTWTFDTFAYLVGVRFGKNKIMPSISPKKSWEGFFGGMLATILVTYFIELKMHIFDSNLWILFAVLIPVLATLGDFVQSYFKRVAKVKDSGSLIPGHGGFYDRMDSVIFVAPFYYLLLKFI